MKDFEEFIRASNSGLTIMHELMEFDKPHSVLSILAASIETWANAKGYNSLELVDALHDTMHNHNEVDIE